MVFVDGTNLLYRLQTEKLKLNVPLSTILARHLGSRDVLRICLYTVPTHLKEGVAIHGDTLTNGVKVIFGDEVPRVGKEPKEKCVDALLVADLVYHAAVRNFDYALVVSTDTDFRYAIKRVEDFGCRTGAMSVCAPLPDRLREVCDDHYIVPREHLLEMKWAIEV